MVTKVPGVECRVGWPCQKPRPGQACNKAMPTQKAPVVPRIHRPNRGDLQAVSGKAMSAPAAQYSRTEPGSPNSQLWPGAKICPKASPNIHTIKPHATVARPPTRHHVPLDAASSHTPSPTWIETAAAGAVTG